MRKDMSGTYEMRWDFGEMATGGEGTEGDSEFLEGMTHVMDSVQMELNTMSGVSEVEADFDGQTMRFAFAFDDLMTMDRLATSQDEDRSAPVFERNGKRFSFLPDVSGNLALMKDDEESSAPDSGEASEGSGQEFFTIRSIITFEDKVKVKEMAHFKREGDRTFIYDSSEQGLDVQPMLDIKY